VVVNVTGPSLYAVSFASYTKRQTWYWSAQYTANALYRNGIRWLGTVDKATSDACSPFGAHLASDSSYYQHFYCSVHTNVRSPYTIIVNVTDKLAYNVKWVDFDDQYPATPAQPRPSAALTATSSASGGSTSTPSTTTPACDLYCNIIGYVTSKTARSSGPSWIDGALVGAALTDAQARAIREQWGSDEAPNGADIWTDQVGCARDGQAQSTPFASVTAC